MKHIWSVLCQKSIVDESTNSISILEVLEGLVLEPRGVLKSEAVGKAFKVRVDFELVSLIQKSLSGEEKANLKIELYDPEGKKLNEEEFKIDFPKDKKRMRVRMKIDVLIFTVIGEYKFVIRLMDFKEKKYNIVAEIPFDLTIESKSTSPIK